jgi:hypothetical protein
VSEPKKPEQPVSMTKASGDTPAKPARPRTVTAAAVALGGSAVAALGAATALYGQTKWLTTEQAKANSTAASSAIANASKSAASASADVPSAVSSASSVAQTKYPTEGSKLSDQVHQQQSGGLIMTLVLVLATSFVAYGVWRGRHWSRWGVLAFWAVASFTGTFAGFPYLLTVGGSLPISFRLLAFASAAAMLAAVVLCQLRPSVEHFALSRPTHQAGARRGLFAPRTPPRSPVGGVAPGAPRKRSPLTSSAADRGEQYVQKQRAKKRSATNAEAVAKGAELARSRAKASKSRRTTDR